MDTPLLNTVPLSGSKQFHISKWPESKNQFDDELKEIFFLSSSRQKFTSGEEKENFYKSWLDYYFANWSEFIYLCVDEKKNLAGYLTGCTNSQAASDEIKKRAPSMALFEDFFHDYPAHLHINTHPDFRGLGCGQKLIEKFVADLQLQKIVGLHIVTLLGDANIQFYKKNGFREIGQRTCGENATLLLMGMKT